MPIYEYRRPDGSTFEVLQSFSDEALTHDPETGVEVTRVLHAPAVHFKGSGFYNTDYGTRRRQREDSEKNKDSASSGSASDSSATKDTAGSSTKEKSSTDSSAPVKSSTKAEPAAKS